MRWARFAYDELKREQRVTQMLAGGSPSLPCYRMDDSGRAGYPSAATDPQRPARVIVFSAEERGGVCKRREPSLRRGWDRAAPQSRRRSFQGHGAYRAHRFGCRSAPATLITARNGGRRRSNRPVEPRMRSCWLCCVTPGALVLPRVSPSVAWRCSSSRCGEAALAARVRSGRGNLRTAVGGLASAASSGRRGSSLLRARGGGRAERPGRSAGREGDAERPRSAARRALPPDRPPPAGAALPRWRASRTCRLGAWEPAAAAAGSAPQQGPYLGGARALSRLPSPSGRRGGARSQPAGPGRAPAPLRASPCWLPTLTPPHPAPGRNGCNGWGRVGG